MTSYDQKTAATLNDTKQLHQLPYQSFNNELSLCRNV